MNVLMMILMVLAGGIQQGPPRLDKLPPANKVTDKARPDFGYMTPWAGNVVTVAVGYSAGCGPCEDSVPFYKRVEALPVMDGKQGAVVLMTDGGIAPVLTAIERRYGRERFAAYVAYPADDRFHVKEFPTLLVFDGAWKQRGVWSGKLTVAQEAAVLELVQLIGKDAKGAAE